MPRFLIKNKELKLGNRREDIEQALAIIRPQTMFAILAISGLLGFSLLWCFTGSIPLTVSGAGILTSQEGIKLVKTPFKGTINSIEINIGDFVEQGQLLATVEQLDLKFEIKKIEETLKSQRVKYKRLIAYIDGGKKSFSIAAFKREASQWNDSLKTYTLQLQKETDEGTTSLLTSKSMMALQKLDEIEFLLAEASTFNSPDIVVLNDKIKETEILLNQKRSEYQFKTQLISPYSGMVVEITLNDGDVFNASHPVMTIENYNSSKSDIKATIFVDAMYGKNIEMGMDVLVSPTSVASEEHGYLTGKVIEVGKYPATKEGLFQVLKNDELVNKMAKEISPIFISVQINTDSSTFSGFKWTSKNGPQMNIVVGTLVDAQIIVEEKKPIQILIPSIKL